MGQVLLRIFWSVKHTAKWLKGPMEAKVAGVLLRIKGDSDSMVSFNCQFDMIEHHPGREC